MLAQSAYEIERQMVSRPSWQTLFGSSIPGDDRAVALPTAAPRAAPHGPVSPAVSSGPVSPGSAPSALPASTVISLLDRAAEAFDSDRAAAKACLARASALLRAEHDPGKLARGGLAPWQIRQVIRHIEAALAATIRTRDCAKIVRLSASHFSRAFKVSFSETFSRYVTRRRTERAQEMMMMTDERLCQIALSCGFADQSHFSRVYQRQVGCSPAAWRRQRRKGPPLPVDLVQAA